MRKTIIAAMLLGIGIGTAAHADIGVDMRQANQQRQIDAGKRSGKLSLRERQILTAEQKRIKAIEGKLRARHGRLTQADTGYIVSLLDKSQAHIERLKNNRERGPDSAPF